MGDVTWEHVQEIRNIRNTQYAAQPTQLLDSTTIFTAEVLRVRNLDAVKTPLDSNTELERTWDGA